MSRTTPYQIWQFRILLLVSLFTFWGNLSAQEKSSYPNNQPLAIHKSAVSKGIWISREEISQLPTSGSAWQNVLSAAGENTDNPDISDQNDPTNVHVMAKALVFVRTGDERLRQDVIRACMAAIGTEDGGRTLALGRELIGYVIAADLVELPEQDDQRFREWLKETLQKNLDGRTLVSTHEDRPNNWGTHAGGSRIAVATYLGDQAELDRAAQVFKGWLGDRLAYDGFEYGDLDWQADAAKPVGINPGGATKQGRSIDGVLPDDQRRAGGFKWPPPKENYVYEGLQGALAQAVLLHRAGYDVWNWGDQALLRAFVWLHEQASYPAEGDDTWQPHLINYYYGTQFPAPSPSQAGKNVGWTDWTHGERDGNSDETALYGNVLRNDTRATIAGGDVQLLQNGTVIRQTQSNAAGSFSFGTLTPGAYELRCSKADFDEYRVNITLAAGQQIFGYEILLVPNAPVLAALAGVVRDALTQQVLPDVAIQLLLGSNTAGTMTTASDGSFQFRDLQAGAYTIIASKTGYNLQQQSLSLAAGESVTGYTIWLTELATDDSPPAAPENVGARQVQ